MTPPRGDPLRTALDLLTRIARLPPDEALAAVRDEPGLDPQDVDLVWHREAYDDSTHFAFIVRSRDGSVVSVSRSERGLPWPLRGVHRWSESDVVRVNGRTMQVEEAIAVLDVDSHDAQVARSIVDSLLVQEELDRSPVAISPDAVQAEMDAFRRARGLTTASATERWLADQGMTHAKLERLLRDRLAVRALRRRVATPAAVQDEFARIRDDYDEVMMTSLWLPAQRDAKRILGGLRRDELELDRSATTIGRRPPPSPDIGVLIRRYRAEVAPELRAAAFGSKTGGVFGPIAFRHGHVVGRVHARHRARLTAAVRSSLERRLFARWLEARRATARIDWMWGRAESSPTNP